MFLLCWDLQLKMLLLSLKGKGYLILSHEGGVSAKSRGPDFYSIILQSQNILKTLCCNVAILEMQRSELCFEGKCVYLGLPVAESYQYDCQFPGNWLERCLWRGLLSGELFEQIKTSQDSEVPPPTSTRLGIELPWQLETEILESKL